MMRNWMFAGLLAAATCGCVSGEAGTKGERGPVGPAGQPGTPALFEVSRLASRW